MNEEACAKTQAEPERASWLSWMRRIKYTVMPNDGRHLRLARLQPRTQCCGLVSIVLETVSFGDKVQYEAVSYAWLVHWKLPLKTIAINGERCEIPMNIFRFLQDRQSEDSEICLWVDSLCINQLNESEKIKQIQLMPDIYGQCTVFTVWLGAPCSDTIYAFDLFKSIDTEETESSGRMKCVGYDVPFYQRIGAIFKCPWWSRLWIVQEVAYGLSSPVLKEARIMAGKYSIAWDVLRTAVFSFDPDPSGGLVSSLEKARLHVKTLRASPEVHSWGLDDDRAFLALSRENSFRKCSLEDDRLLALMSLVGPKKDFNDLNPGLRLSFQNVYETVLARIDAADREAEATKMMQRHDTSCLLSNETSLWTSRYWGVPAGMGYPKQSKIASAPFPNTTTMLPKLEFSSNFLALAIRGRILDEIQLEFSIPSPLSTLALFDLHKAYCNATLKVAGNSSPGASTLFWEAVLDGHEELEAVRSSCFKSAIEIGEDQWFQPTSARHRQQYCYRGTCKWCKCLLGNILYDSDVHPNYENNPFELSGTPRLKPDIAIQVRDIIQGRSLLITKTGIPILAPDLHVRQRSHDNRATNKRGIISDDMSLAILEGSDVPLLLDTSLDVEGKKRFEVVAEARVQRRAFMKLQRYHKNINSSGSEVIQLLARSCA